MFTKSLLQRLYLVEKHSVAEIAKRTGCSQGQVNYWLKKFEIPKRSISDAVYQKWNPLGDPFVVRQPKTLQKAVLYGLGLGLYWGEGTKSNRTTLRLGNTDPRLIRTFIRFLDELYGVKKHKLKFGLQIFSDMPPKEALGFWRKFLKVSPRQFHKVIVTPARSLGTYRYKTKHGVLTIYFNNRKLRDIICQAIEDIDGVLSKPL